MVIDHTNKNMLYLIQTKGGVKMNERNILCIDLKNIFGKKAKKVLLSKDEIAEFLKINPEALIKFEESYKNHVLGKKMLSDNFFAINAKQIVEEKKKRLISDITAEQGDIDAIAKRIVAELLDCSIIYAWDGKDAHLETFDILPE